MNGSTSHIKNLPNHSLVQLKYQDYMKRELQNLKKISIQFGSALAMERQIQRTIAASNTRNSGIPTSNHALELLTGGYDKLEFSDYLGRNKAFDVDESVFYKMDRTN